MITLPLPFLPFLERKLCKTVWKKRIKSGHNLGFMRFLLLIFTKVPCILTNVRRCLVYVQENTIFFTILILFVTIYSSKKGGGSYEKESFEKNDRLFY